MLESKNKLVVYKTGQINERQGFVTPVLKITESGEFERLSRDDYPADIFISKGYSTIDNQFDDGQLFILKSHVLDEEKTEQFHSPRYWADDSFCATLNPNTLLPVIISSLPDKETGILEAGIEPPTTAFFILDGEKLYGPITSSLTDDNKYIIEPYTHPSFSFGKGYLGVYSVTEVQNSFVKCSVGNEQLLLISSFKHLAEGRKENKSIDYLSNDQLIKVVNQTGFGQKRKALGKKEAERLQQFVTDFEKNNKFIKDERMNRLKGMLDKYLLEADTGYDLIKDYLDSTSGQRFITSYVESHKEKLLSSVIDRIKSDADAEEAKIQKQLDEKRSQLSIFENEISKIQSQITRKRIDAQEEIEKLALETQEEKNRILTEDQERHREELSSMSQKLEEVELEIREKCSTLELIDEIASLKRECAYFETHKTKLEKLVDGYTAALDNTTLLSEKIGEMEAIQRILNGKKPSQNSETPCLECSPIEFCTSIPDSAEDLVSALCNQFSIDGGKVFSTEEMTNLMVCSEQSFLTVLAGPPGTGKTSTATRLAEALHLGSSYTNQNFLSIPVGRGWVSSRDILGFYNSLKDVYQESRTGLYNFLSQHSVNETDTRKLILLDEANLSSVEHYWSDFLSYCDKENLVRPLDIGIPDIQKRYLSVDPRTRFIATINSDSTTEPLSPRLIDRVPVISLDRTNLQLSEGSGYTIGGTIPASKLKELFTSEDPELSRAQNGLLNEVIVQLTKRDGKLGASLNISQRKVNAITHYVDVAGKLIGSEAAMDFALSQFVLPHIEGFGPDFRVRIEQLQDKVSKYQRTTDHLDRVLSKGNNLSGSYSFFG
ncbi:AAA family ATPase [Enterovibrio baiacu]|uniref:AAA family ATPase n=1 Tax=Enterovibrio baiacu TaxID=2491023 RepID=UPI003D0E2E15